MCKKQATVIEDPCSLTLRNLTKFEAALDAQRSRRRIGHSFTHILADKVYSKIRSHTFASTAADSDGL